MAVDLLNTVIEAVIETLPVYYNEGLTPDNKLYLKSLVRGPLQDDPTTRAFFMTISLDEEEGVRKPVVSLTNTEETRLGPMPEYEIGGGYLMVNYFRLDGWTPRQSTAENNFRLIGEALARVEQALQRMKYQDFFEEIATDNEMETTAGLLNIFSSGLRHFRVIGGENERYGVLMHKFALFSQIDTEYWS